MVWVCGCGCVGGWGGGQSGPCVCNFPLPSDIARYLKTATNRTNNQNMGGFELAAAVPQVAVMEPHMYTMSAARNY